MLYRLFPISFQNGKQPLHGVNRLIVVLGEVDAEAVQILGSELGSRGHDDAGQLAHDADKVVQGDFQFWDRNEQVAAAFRGPRRYAGDGFDDLQNIVADLLMLRNSVCQPAFRFVEPGLEHRLVIAAAAQRHDGLQLFHALDDGCIAEGCAETVAA